MKSKPNGQEHNFKNSNKKYIFLVKNYQQKLTFSDKCGWLNIITFPGK